MSCAAKSPLIFSCAGKTLTDDEKKFFKDAAPAGFILFQKHCDNPEQLKKLTSDLRACVGWDAPILIDQEGGRVQRLKPPHWPNFPAAKTIGDVYTHNKQEGLDACTKAVKGLADVQLGLGFDVNCIPVLDVVPADNEALIISDRSYSNDPNIVAALGAHACRVAIESGMTPVMKHMPGHGRAKADSHTDLPYVNASQDVMRQTDWLPFKHVAARINNDRLWGMSAHVIYTDVDPELPGTISPTVVHKVIRGEIGFQGLYLSDDVFMEALAKFGDIPKRAVLALEAGCDLVLHCHGDLTDCIKAAKAVPALSAPSRTRLDAWHKTRV